MTTESKPKIPITLISGFLGSGKTTLLNHLLETLTKKGLNGHKKKVAVILNEFAMEFGLNNELKSFADDKDSALCSLEEVFEFGQGCLCCSSSGQFMKSLETLAESHKNLDYVLVEFTGRADPGPVVRLFNESRYKAVQDAFYIDGIVTVVDTERILSFVAPHTGHKPAAAVKGSGGGGHHGSLSFNSIAASPILASKSGNSASLASIPSFSLGSPTGVGSSGSPSFLSPKSSPSGGEGQRKAQRRGGLSDADSNKDTKPTSEEYKDETLSQLLYADRIILNKIDLVDEKELESVRANIAVINSFAKVVECKYSDVSPEFILGISSLHPDLVKNVLTPDEVTFKQHDPNVQSVCVAGKGRIALADVSKWINGITAKHEVYRVKGCLSVVDEPRKVILQGVGRRLNVTYHVPWKKGENRASVVAFIGPNVKELKLDDSTVLDGVVVEGDIPPEEPEEEVEQTPVWEPSDADKPAAAQ